MKKQTKDIAGSAGVAAFALAITVMSGMAAAAVTENAEPLAWATTNAYGAVTVSNAGGGMVVVSFAAQDPAQPPTALRADIVAGGDPALSPFAGNFLAAGVSNIAFRIRTDAVAGSLVTFLLKGKSSGYLWKRDAQMPASAGVWATNIVSLRFSDGWRSGSEEQWLQDLRNVEFVGVRLSPRGGIAQSLAIDNLILIGPSFTSSPALLVALGDLLEARFGVRDISLLSSAQKTKDADADGMTDLDEILAGSNPDDKTSVFAAQVVSVTQQGVTIRWPSVSGGVYTVSRTTNLIGNSFIALPSGYRLTAPASGYMEFTDTSANASGGPYFYRIVKE